VTRKVQAKEKDILTVTESKAVNSLQNGEKLEYGRSLQVTITDV